MERLNTDSLPAFLETAGVAVIMFGAPEGQATLDQAEEFALLWADHVADAIVGVRFGYIDGQENWEASTLLGAFEFPVTLIIRNGVVTHRFERPHLRGEIAEALHAPRSNRLPSNTPVWTAPLPWQTGARIAGIQFDGVVTREAA